MLRKIAIGFVIYDPNLNQLNRIHEASRLGFSVYVYDNSPEKIDAKEFAKNRGDVVYLTCGKNVGLGRGMASVCAQAYYDQHPALVFFDQDTVFNVDTLYFIEEYYETNLVLGLKYSAILFSSKDYTALDDPNAKNHFKNVSLAINSGSLFFLENVKKLNWHNDRYFVDCVDYEFCLNSQIHGFEIGEFSSTPGFDHSLEQDDVEYNVLGRTFLMRAYSRRRVIDTCSASLKLLFKSIIARRLKFFSEIFKLLIIYIATQIFVRTVGWIFEKRI